MIRGIDASSVQGAIPFWLMSKDIRFAILKGQQGNDGFDPWLKRNVQQALKEGVEPFAYCFAYPLPGSSPPGRTPKEQAVLFVERTLETCPELVDRPLFLDYEWPEPEKWKRWGCTASQINDWCEENAYEVEQLSGVTPIIYTYPYWWAAISKGADVSWAAHYPLWLASYPKAVGWPTEEQGKKLKLPKPWSEWLFWQFDGNGGLKLPNGVDCDFCVFNGNDAALARLAAKPVTELATRPVHSTEHTVIEDVAKRP